MTAHTPGPWHTRDLDLGAPHISAGSRLVAKVLYHMGSEDASVVQANARLIAAAPDLLAACEAAYRTVGLFYHADVARQVKAAIDKAVTP